MCYVQILHMKYYTLKWFYLFQIWIIQISKNIYTLSEFLSPQYDGLNIAKKYIHITQIYRTGPNWYKEVITVLEKNIEN